jgi:hypothetical protein
MAQPGVQAAHMEALLERLRARLLELEGLQRRLNGWEEDGVYRFYHGSFKVFRIQQTLKEALALIREIGGASDPIDLDYLQIVQEGIARSFSEKTNENWLAETRPILEAYWHTQYFLNMMVQYAKTQDPLTPPIGSGWAAVLYLFQMR